VKLAVTETVQQAVEGVLQAVTAHPELLHGLAAQLAPPAAPALEQLNAGTAADRPAGPVGRVRAWVSSRLRQAGSACAAVKRRAGSLLACVYDRLSRPRLLTIIAVGTGAAALAYLYGPVLAAGAGVLAAWLLARLGRARDGLYRLLAPEPMAA
jgi:hypothetical protein